MKTSELKKLAVQLSEFIGEDFENIEGKVREFWFATFGCNNAEREAELLKEIELLYKERRKVDAQIKVLEENFIKMNMKTENYE